LAGEPFPFQFQLNAGYPLAVKDLLQERMVGEVGIAELLMDKEHAVHITCRQRLQEIAFSRSKIGPAGAWRPGENSVENVDDLINVPFSEDEDLWIHIILSGDGMYARVSEQTGEYFKINVLSPQRAGEISSITVKDNEGHTVYLWRSYPSFAMTTFVLGVSEGEMFATPPEEIKLAKVPGMSTRFYVELTNAWGASRTVMIGVSPYKSEFEAMFDTFLLVLFGVLVGAIFFSAGARWFRMSHRAWIPYG
jgi:hypothetical protein